MTTFEQVSDPSKLSFTLMLFRFGALLPFGALMYAVDFNPPLTKFQDFSPVFEPNTGQAPDSVLYLARDNRGTLAITRTGAEISLTKWQGQEAKHSVVQISFPGAAIRNVIPEEFRPSKTHLLLGNNRSQWRTDIANYGKVRITNAYPGIDLVFHAKNGIVEFDFEVAPGADPGRVRLAFGDRTPELLEDGSLRITTQAGDLLTIA